MDNVTPESSPPRDKYKLVYLVMLLHGIGILLPWNMFITARSYFVEYKLSENYTGISPTVYATYFMPYLGFAAQIPNVLFNWANIFMHSESVLTFKTKVVGSIIIEVIVFIVTIILAIVDSSGWPGTFFSLTLGCVVVLNIANGIYQNTIYGLAAKLPFKYTGVLILGTNICGTFTAIVNILSGSFSQVRTAAICYFITAIIVLFLCVDTYLTLPLNQFYRYYEVKNQNEVEIQKQRNDGLTPRVPYWFVFKTTFPQLRNIFVTFFVTLAVFPEIHSSIKKTDSNFIISDKYFTSITCFLTFNAWSMIGAIIPSWFNWPKPKYLWIPVTLRIVFIPLFFVCNYQPEGIVRSFPVFITNEYIYWSLGILVGFTNGYYSSLGMKYAPRTVQPEYAATAGMFAGATLITGIFGGILFSFIWPYVAQLKL